MYDGFKLKPEQKKDAIVFWIENENLSPKLNELALELLTKQGTSMLVERLFISSEFTVNKHRNSLSPDSVESCLRIKSNKDLLSL